MNNVSPFSLGIRH